MAFNPDPSAWITGWSTAGTATTSGSHVSFPIASVPELTAAEAQETSGDIRKVVFALVDKLHKAYIAASAAGDAPTKMDIFRSASVNTTTGVVNNSFTFTIQTEITGQEVMAED